MSVKRQIAIEQLRTRREELLRLIAEEERRIRAKIETINRITADLIMERNRLNTLRTELRRVDELLLQLLG